MVQMSWFRIGRAIVENSSKRLGITALVSQARGRAACGGVRWTERPINENLQHVRGIASSVLDHLGDVRGKIGCELGPGDNVGVAYCMLKAGAHRMYAVEKYGSVAPNEWSAEILGGLDKVFDGLPHADDVQHGRVFNRALLCLERTTFEHFDPPEPMDFIFSHDVLEHVDPVNVFRRAYDLLRPGGLFVNVVDLTGHGVFYDLQRPLDFLTCPKWLWSLMFSHMETTNCVRFSDFVQISEDSGFEVRQARPIRRAAPDYLRSIRPHLQPQYRFLSDDDLSAMQCVFVLEKPKLSMAQIA